MKTINLQIQDDYFDKLLEYLETLPKGVFSLKEDTDNNKKLKAMEKDIIDSFNDIKEGQTRVVRTIA